MSINGQIFYDKNCSLQLKIGTVTWFIQSGGAVFSGLHSLNCSDKQFVSG